MNMFASGEKHMAAVAYNELAEMLFQSFVS